MARGCKRSLEHPAAARNLQKECSFCEFASVIVDTMPDFWVTPEVDRRGEMGMLECIDLNLFRNGSTMLSSAIAIPNIRCDLRDAFETS